MNNQPTAPQDSGAPDEPFVSRQQYREQQAKQRRRPTAAQPNPDQDAASSLRHRGFADERASQDEEEQVSRLKRRLNIAIGALVIAIIIVYLILFYVG